MEKPPSRLSSLFGKKDKGLKDKPKDPSFIDAKHFAEKQLIARAERIMQEADRHSAEPLGMSLLLQAERHMNRLENVQAAETSEALEKALEEKTMDFSDVAKEQSRLLKSRRGLDIAFHPVSPEITEEQLAVFHEIFGVGNLESVVLPTAEQFTDAYVQALYPKEETKDDKEHGIVNHHPDYWNQAAAAKYQATKGETWGSVFLRSMKEHLKAWQEESAGANPVMLQESIIKPKYKVGGSSYGSKEGSDATLDPFLSIVKEVYGAGASRFNYAYDDLMEKLIPKIDKIIRKRLRDKGLLIPKFKITLVPSVSSNLTTVLKHSESSQTDTWEWVSDTMLDKDGKDSGRRLIVGGAGRGGAGYVDRGDRGGRGDSGGFRLAVVLTP